MRTGSRIVIIEDEPVIARELAHLLKQLDATIIIVNTLQSVQDAVVWLKEHPEDHDLLFMDIQLSDGQSFDIFKQVIITKPVVFVTAYHEHALQAFKNNGLDYILKPFDKEDVQQALLKYQNWIGRQVPDHLQYHELIKKISVASKPYKRAFLVHYRNKLIPLEANQVAWFYTSNEMVYAHTYENKQYHIDLTMEQLMQQLDPEQFFRANRQFILQRSAILEADFFFNSRLLIKVKPEPPEKIIISKARVPDFKAWMNS